MSFRNATLTLHTETPAEQAKTRLLAALVVLTQVAGNISLSHGMTQMGAVVSFSPVAYLRSVLNPWVAGGVVVLAFWMLANLSLLSRADLSYVLPVTSISYALIAVCGHFFLHEEVGRARWFGIAVIMTGMVVVGRTPTRTTPDVFEPEAQMKGIQR